MSQEELLEMIHRAEKEKAVKLDFSELDEISQLPPEIGRVTSLEVLIVTGLNELPKEIAKLKNLNRLYLNSNYLSELPREIVQLKKLSILDLSFNYLTEFPKEIVQLKNLSILDISSNQLSELPKEIGKLRNLSILDISSNYLGTLPREIAQLKNLVQLDLSSNQLNELPKEIAQFKKLSILDLSFNHLSEVPKEIAQLRNLTVLSLNSNHLSELPTEIAQLRNLTQLYLNFNQVKEVTKGIAQLRNLSILSLNSNYLSSLPKEIAQLRNLTELYLGNNQLSVLPESVALLRNLSILDISSNYLTELPKDIARLKNLTVLYLDSNELARLPKEIAQLKDLNHLDVNKNPLTFPPLEIVSQGLPAVIDYLKNSGRGGQTLYEGKLLVVGQGGVGKTCLVKRLTLDKFSENEVTTKGIDIRSWKVTAPNDSKTEMSLNVWDFGGQEIYHATHQFFLTQRSLYILVWDARQEEEYGRIDYWLKTIRIFAEDSPILIVMNKADERNKDLNIKEMKDRCPQIIASRKVSAKMGRGIEELRKFIGKQAWSLPLMGTFWPASWLAVRKALKASPRYHLPYNNYLQVCKKLDIEESEAGTLSRYLHDLGIILHFQDDPLLKDTIILKPEWGTDAVYKVLDAKIVRDRNGILHDTDLPKIWSNRALYPKEKYAAILRLMANFELAFPFGKEGRHIVAGFLSPKEVNYNWNARGCLQFEYHYEFLPSGMMTRLIVRMHEFLMDRNEEKLCWREGAYLEYDRSQAMLKIDPYTKIAMIQIKGPEKREFLAIIRSHFDAVHKSIRKILFKEKIPCICTPGCKHRFEYTFLAKCEGKGIKDVICEKNAEYINVGNLLDSIERTEIRREKMKQGEGKYPKGRRGMKPAAPPKKQTRGLGKFMLVLGFLLIILASIFIWMGWEISDIFELFRISFKF